MGWEDGVGLLDITILTPPSCRPSDHRDARKPQIKDTSGRGIFFETTFLLSLELCMKIHVLITRSYKSFPPTTDHYFDYQTHNGYHIFNT